MKPVDEYALAMAEVHKMHAMRAHAEIVSGAYKFDKRDLTDDVKLQAKVDEMCRHINLQREKVMEAFNGAVRR